MKKLDRYIIFRLFVITIFLVAVLIFIYVVIDFSQRSDDFTNHGATIVQVIEIYYLNYIPEIIRLVTPVAVLLATLLLTGQMSDRFEIVAIKAAGISLYRLAIPYLIFGFFACIVVSYFDGFIVPKSNAIRMKFEQKYLGDQSEKIDRSKVYRQESPHSIMLVNYFDPKEKVGYKVQFFRFKDGNIVQTLNASRIEWQPKSKKWKLVRGFERDYSSDGYKLVQFDTRDTTLNVMPLDLARTSSDVSQLTYPEIVQYIGSLERSGATGLDLPKVQFYSRLSYPFSIIVGILIGLSMAAVKTRGGLWVNVAYGLLICFVYLALMKISEPFGYSGEMSPLVAALLPHAIFFSTGIAMLITARK